MNYITPTQHEKNEWSRLAQAAYAIGHNQIGHRYSVAASICRDGKMATEYFDRLQAGYRQWLLSGFASGAGDVTIPSPRFMLPQQGYMGKAPAKPGRMPQLPLRSEG